MQLEKVTSRSSEAALAGWISSNDVTLFTTMLVMVIAVFLHARLSQGAKETVQITAEKASLTERLEAIASERDAYDKLLVQTRGSLSLTQDERDQLQQQLVEKLADIARLNARLEVLLAQKSELELQRRTLVASEESLSKEKTELMVQQTTLAKDRNSLQTANTSLLQRLEAISGQLAAKVAALEQIEQQRDRLKKQADALDAIVASLKQRLEELNIDLAESRARATSSRTELQTKVKDLEAQIAARDKTAEEYLAELKRATTLFQGLRVEKEQLQRALSATELQRQAELLEEGSNNRELVGLTGRLERVAILFDASGSMRLAANNGGGDRWAEAQQIAATWLKHLNVQQCVLIVFSTGVRTFPKDGSLADLRGDAGKVRRDSLLEHVKAVSPAGWTNTYDALRTAYQYDVDSILLFSDGAPTLPNSGGFSPPVARQIYDLCRAHPNIPIHTIGVGNYFDKDASEFLQSVAKITGGTFRGR